MKCPKCESKMNWIEDEGQPRHYFCKCGYQTPTLLEMAIEANKCIKQLLGKCGHEEKVGEAIEKLKNLDKAIDKSRIASYERRNAAPVATRRR